MFPSAELNCFSSTPATPASTGIARKDNVFHSIHQITCQLQYNDTYSRHLVMKVLKLCHHTRLSYLAQLNVRSCLNLYNRRTIRHIYIKIKVNLGLCNIGIFLSYPKYEFCHPVFLILKMYKLSTYQQNNSRCPLSTLLHGRIFPKYHPRK